MAGNDSVNVKTYLERVGQDPEIRRFSVSEDVSTSFEYVKGKIASLYPSLAQKDYEIYWKDDEEDNVVIGSDDELIQALLYRDDQANGATLLRLFLKIEDSARGNPCKRGPCKPANGKASEGQQVHPGIVCDSCDAGPIRGLRYKCLVCSDYDLCSSCCEKGVHNHHFMLRMAQPAGEWNRSCSGGRGGNRPGRWWQGFGGQNPWAWAMAAGGPQGPGRRFMRQFMRGQGQNDESNATGGDAQAPEGNPTASAAGPTDPDTSANRASAERAAEVDYLQHVGEQVSAFLEPLGIDVDVDIEERGAPNPHKGFRRGRCTRNGKCKPDASCRKEACKMQTGYTGAPSDTATGADTQSAAPVASAPPAADTEQQTAGSSGEQNIMDQSAAAGSDCSLLGAEGNEMDSDDNSWIKVENKADGQSVDHTQSPGQASAGNPPPILYPSLVSYQQTRPTVPFLMPMTSPAPQGTDLDQKVAAAAEHMRKMGFHDEGGWLTASLYQHNGDMNKALDTILKLNGGAANSFQ